MPTWTEYTYFDCEGEMNESYLPSGLSPLQCAAASLLPRTCARLLAENADPNGRLEGAPAPIHLAISKCHYNEFFGLSSLELFRNTNIRPLLKKMEISNRRLNTVHILVDHGADLGSVYEFRSNRTSSIEVSFMGDFDISPLCLALMFFELEVSNLLLELGASLEPSPAGLGMFYMAFEAVLQYISFNEPFMPSLLKTGLESLVARISAHIESNKKEEPSPEPKFRSHRDRGQFVVEEKIDIEPVRSTSDLMLPTGDEICVEATRQNDETSTFKDEISAMSFASGMYQNGSPEATILSTQPSEKAEYRNSDLDMALATRDVELLIQRIEFNHGESRKSQSPLMMAYHLGRPDIVKYLRKEGFNLYTREVVQFYSENTKLAKELLGPIKHHLISVSRAQLRCAFVDFLDNKPFPNFEELDYILDNASTDNSDILARLTSLAVRRKHNLRAPN
ncbi:uncharacterized protein BDZ99DRAFT_59716 [Mytilinidion resinicola]|uniref:Ankyrin n=1 Tax=Mytilinidion resinicola TaxID=574789 RepID=A0A6A6YIF7_9PEZI|nr:uncharacterized protein BDZ99DRAFT_59716 [Mytilinidion resinicola]KAF2808626.1 hypothetical protein BDZ99DRAFT_59716 [Mytilinidion resinicola]